MEAPGDAVVHWQHIVETQIRYGEACDARDWELLRIRMRRMVVSHQSGNPAVLFG